jgi:hypothetical protein
MQTHVDMMRASAPKNDPLRKIVCSGCGKTIWVNRETKYCFDCETRIVKDNPPADSNDASP